MAGLYLRHPLGMEGSASLFLSGLCRLRNCPATKNSHVSVCGPRVHTRNKTQHTQCHSFIHSFIHSFKRLTHARAARARTVRRETRHTRVAQPSAFKTYAQCVCPRLLRSSALLRLVGTLPARYGMQAGDARTFSSVSSSVWVDVWFCCWRGYDDTVGFDGFSDRVDSCLFLSVFRFGYAAALQPIDDLLTQACYFQ